MKQWWLAAEWAWWRWEEGLDPGFASELELHPSLMDVEHDRKEAGEGGTRVFGLAAGKKKLPLIELGKQADGTDIWQGPWGLGVGQKSERGFGRLMLEMALQHPHGNGKDAVRCVSMESWGEIQAGGIHLGTVSVRTGFKTMALEHLQAWFQLWRVCSKSEFCFFWLKGLVEWRPEGPSRMNRVISL